MEASLGDGIGQRHGGHPVAVGGARSSRVLALVAVGWVCLTAWSPVVHGHPAYPVLLALTVLGALSRAVARSPSPRPPGRLAARGSWPAAGAGRRLGRRHALVAPVRRGAAGAGGDALRRVGRGDRVGHAHRAGPRRRHRERGGGLLPARRPGRRPRLRGGAPPTRRGRAPRGHRQAAPRHRLPRAAGLRRGPVRAAPGAAVGAWAGTRSAARSRRSRPTRRMPTGPPPRSASCSTRRTPPATCAARSPRRSESVSGSEDGLATPAKIEASRADLPADATFTVIEGGYARAVRGLRRPARRRHPDHHRRAGPHPHQRGEPALRRLPRPLTAP